MRSLFFTLTLLASAPLFAAQTLKDFRYELSCTRMGVESPTIAVHAIIEYDAKTNTCKTENGNYFEGSQFQVSIAFECEPPKLAVLTESHAIQSWVLSAKIGTDDTRITRLAVLLHQGSEKGVGFATSENGIVHTVLCKRW